MKRFASKYIKTEGHPFVGTEWPFRDCHVTMHSDGFECDCMKRPHRPCGHIKSVEMGILGVNRKQYRLAA